MKTITLDDEAYDRLKGWKRGPADSFSVVVKRIVPRAGTLEAMLRFAGERSAESVARDEVMQSSIEDRSTAKADAWT